MKIKTTLCLFSMFMMIGMPGLLFANDDIGAAETEVVTTNSLKESLRDIMLSFREILAEIIDDKSDVDSSAALQGEVLGASTSNFVYRGNLKNQNWETRVGSAHGLKVFWWNIKCDYTNNAGDKNKNNNLRNLINSDVTRPDVVILGEYCANAMESATLQAFKANGYKYRKRIFRYTPFHLGDKNKKGDENGMIVFSRFPIENPSIKRLTNINGFLGKDYVKQCLANNPKYNGSDVKESKFNYWRRPYLDFEVTKNKKQYHLAAVHFANPWPFIGDCLNNTTQTGLKLVAGVHNPAYAQATTIANTFANKQKTLVIGDTNSPRDIQQKVLFFNISLDSNPYEILAQKLGESDVTSNTPTVFSGSGNFIIDHAFASKDLKVPFAEVIPFAGSDHTSIYTVINQ